MGRPLPDPSELTELLKMLLGRSVAVTVAKPLAATQKDPRICALYTGDSGALQAACVADLKFSVYAAAALSLIPPAAAADSVKSGKITEEIRDNIAEVMNVSAKLLNVPGQEHVLLNGIHVLPVASLPPAAATLVGKPALRADYEAVISGYGAGRFSFLS